MRRPAFVLLLLCSLPFAAQADSAWVSDRFEVMLRTGPSTGNAIQMMLTAVLSWTFWKAMPNPATRASGPKAARKAGY